VIERGHSSTEVAARRDINEHSLYAYVQRAKQVPPRAPPTSGGSDTAELRRLRAQLKRVTEERDIIKKAAAYFAKG
jgi:transposase